MKHLVVTVMFAALVLSGCASASKTIDHRTLHGPRAGEIWMYRMVTTSGREPSFEERTRWGDQLDTRISRYLAQHPDVANSFDVGTFRFEQQVAVGMTKEQVLLLIDKPDSRSADPAELEKLARRFWPQVKEQATEAWVYPLGWRLYFGDSRLVDITQYLPPK